MASIALHSCVDLWPSLTTGSATPISAASASGAGAAPVFGYRSIPGVAGFAGHLSAQALRPMANGRTKTEITRPPLPPPERPSP